MVLGINVDIYGSPIRRVWDLVFVEFYKQSCQVLYGLLVGDPLPYPFLFGGTEVSFQGFRSKGSIFGVHLFIVINLFGRRQANDCLDAQDGYIPPFWMWVKTRIPAFLTLNQHIKYCNINIT